MNFLAHLHLAYLAKSSLFGNLVADFIKGEPAHHYDPDIVQGIMMHRRIDKLSNERPEIQTALTFFRQDVRRIAPITLDIVWDHFLSRYWTELEKTISLEQFCQRAQWDIASHQSISPVSFQYLNGYLWQERWLENYAQLPFIEKVLKGMAKRRPKLIKLSDSFFDITQNYEALELLFFQFYPDLMHQASHQRL